MKIFISVLLLLANSCFQTEPEPKTQFRILFVGNSLTYTNNLPDLVARIGEREGFNIETEMLAYPNYALEDHWNDGELQKLLAQIKFDFVVVQQGPSSQEEGRAILLEYGKKIKALCLRHEAKLAFYMVWPAKQNYHMFDGVIKNYSDVAIQTQSILCPVGKVWRDYFELTQDYKYYGPDAFHPSLEGSKVAAQVIFDSISVSRLH